MTIDPTGESEGISMTLRRASPSAMELITADIALQLGKMVLVRLYGDEYVDARSPLVVNDLAARWEIRSRDGIPPGERLQIVIAKFNARILELCNF